MSSWSKVSECVVRGSYARATKWRSAAGLTLVLADVEGPLVNTFTCLATEAYDDDGLPHTLEHLIFLGSEDYPYKGLLDLFANRCFASGTNAWTDTDHTAYTLKTAGSKGMLAMLPVYLDHILYPLLTDHAFTTEVHHITKEGKNAGVVYSEMQGRENNATDRCLLQLNRALFAGTGYVSQTGGILQNIRNSTTNEKVKKYHSEFYRPDNITIVITGQIDKEDIFKALQPIEDKIIKKNKENPPAPFVRPWQNPIPPLKETKIIREKYPTDSEDCGVIMVGWRGPKTTDYDGSYEFTGCCILLRYLTETPIAPFQKALVEIEDPFASDVALSLFENSTSALVVTLENVPLLHLNDALPELRKIISSMASASNTLDLERIHTVIEKQLRETLSHVENQPHDTVALNCISDMLYSSNDKQLDWRINKQDILQNLQKETCDWWENLFKKYFLKDFVAVIGEPSSDLMKELAEEENSRVEEQKQTLGEAGLAEKDQQLIEAMNYNDRDPPAEILSSIDVNDCGDLKNFTIEEWYTGGSECPHFNIKDLPFYARINNVHSQFVYITLLMNTCTLTKQERRFLPLLIEVLTETTFYRNHCKMEFNVMVEDIERLTNALNIDIGATSSSRFSTGSFHNTVSIYTQCEPDKYNDVVDLLWHILIKTHFERRRVIIVAQKMVNDIAQIRRDGCSMVTRLLRDLVNKKDTNVNAVSVLRQQKFLTEAIAKLEKDDNETHDFLNMLDCVRQKLVNANNIWLHFAADLEKNKYSTEPWNVFRTEKSKCQSDGTFKCEIFTDDHKLLIDPEERQGLGCVVGMGGVDSSYVDQYSPGPQSYSHPDYPALLVAIQYFTQLEGQMWRMIRGAGLAYGYSITPKPLEGLIHLDLFKAADPSQAYEKAKSIIETFLQSGSWDENLFKSAKSSLVFEMVKSESSPSRIVKQSLKRFLQGVDLDFTMTIVKAITNVTKDDITVVAKRWLTGLFDPNLKTTVIVCNTAKVDEIKEAFQKMGHENMKVYKSLEDSHLAANED